VCVSEHSLIYSCFPESFRKFDYGIKTNLALYGSTQPPKYILERVKVPMVIFYSENDYITHHTVSSTISR